MPDSPLVASLERPHRNLLVYYTLRSLIALPLFPIVFLPQYFRYHTLRYRFDDEGVSARWGILFRREISLTYSRLQDIHLQSNLIERWLGLARVQLQTASGSAGAEMTIEGLQEYEAVRDYLYNRMRGARSGGAEGSATDDDGAVGAIEPSSELAALLGHVASEMVAIRQLLEERLEPDRQPETAAAESPTTPQV